MGLASSQARLLTLTSRQHAVEGKAQRLLSEKMRLSNQSDAVYQKYMDALENHTLKTLQIDHAGEQNWIDGSIKNLMRYNADDKTSGEVFYVQDLQTGKLFVPKEVADNYANYTAATVPSGHEYTDAMKFATLYGVEYRKVDKNEEIKLNYETAIKLNWHNAMTNEQYDNYMTEIGHDNEAHYIGNVLLGMVPLGNSSKYEIDTKKDALPTNFETYVSQVLGMDLFKNVCNNDDFNLLTQAVNVLHSISAPIYPDETGEGNYFAGPPAYYVDSTYTVAYNTTKLSAKNGSNNYLSEETSAKDFTGGEKFLLMLNGGTMTWEGLKVTVYADLDVNKYNGRIDPATNTADIYNADTTAAIAKYSSSGAKNLGDALRIVFTKISNTTANADTYLASINKTKADVEHHKQFKIIASRYELYTPDYEYIPSDNVKSKYYETLFNSIQAAGGCTEVSNSAANSAIWVENMLKNNLAMITTWDKNENILSKTSPSLNTNIREVNDDHEVEQAEQDYEAALALINTKDTTYDTILNQLETERDAMKTEIEAIEKVMKNNSDTYFKVFS